MVNTRASKRKSQPTNSNDAAVASAKRSHLTLEDIYERAGASDAGILAVGDGKSKSASDTPNISIPPRENDFNTKTWWMVDLTSIGGSSSQGATALVKRCMRTYGWDETKTRKVLAAYRQFIILKKELKDWDDNIVSPCHLVDQMWICHIVDVVNYYHDMMLLCGHVVDHNPDGALDHAAMQKRDKTTRASLKKHFGSYDEEVWHVWDYSEGQQSANMIRIYVRKQLDGTTYSVLVRSTATVGIVKQNIQQFAGIPCEHQTLIFAGKILLDGGTFGYYNIGPEHTLFLVTRAGW